MTTVTIKEAQRNLAELIDHLAAWDRVTITRGTQPVARLERAEPGASARRLPGSARGRITVVNDDDDHLRDFEEYAE